MTSQSLDKELTFFPNDVSDAVLKVNLIARRSLSDEEFTLWLNLGLDMARNGGKARQAAKEYFRASQFILDHIPFPHIKQWAYWGGELAKESPEVASSFFETSPATFNYLKPGDIGEWAQLGRKLYSPGTKAGMLCVRYFETSAVLLKCLSFTEFRHLVDLVGVISENSTDEAMKFLSSCETVLPGLREDVRSCLSLISVLAKGHWKQVNSCLAIMETSLSRIERVERSRFLALVGRISESTDTDVVTFLGDSSLALGEVEGYIHIHVLNIAESLFTISPETVGHFIKGVPHALKRINVSQLEPWYEIGAKLLRDNLGSGVGFFSHTSSRSEQELERLSKSVELIHVKDTMRLYSRALTALDVEIAPIEEQVAAGSGWLSIEGMMGEGDTTVYLPSVVERFNSKSENFDWHKVVTTHQVAHLEFRSFAFSLEANSVLFPNMILELAAKESFDYSGTKGDDSFSEIVEPSTDIQRFFSMFDDGLLVRDIFTAVEDFRLDHRIKLEYPGIQTAYKLVQDQSIRERPEIEGLPYREALVEILIRFGLQQDFSLLPQNYTEAVTSLWDIINPLVTREASVQDSAEATIRLYNLISQLPNENVPPQDEDSQGSPREQQEESKSDENDDESFNGEADNMSGQPAMDGMEKRPYESPQKVDYRGDFNPELMQLMALLKESQEDSEVMSESVSPEELQRLLAEANQSLKQASIGWGDHEETMVSGTFEESGPSESPQGAIHIQQNDMPPDPYSFEYGSGRPLESKEPASFVYDEWDYRISDYRSRWCLLREKEMVEGDSGYFGATLDGYATLAAQIRRQFELMVPQALLKEKRQQDGDELDFDSLIEAMIDKKSGTSPSDKVYLRLNKVQRDVAVVFLLDMSASTAEAIDESQKFADEWDAPDDPLEYMFWLRNRRGEGVRRSYKRIVDLEKESLVLLIHALETIGDTYGIYGFSGYGRENVDFFVIKDIKEVLSEKVKARIDRVSPLQATRMGPAIRHAVTKLEGLEARDKFLILISDGRPQDRGYSREGVEKQYAIHDTRIALIEAKRKGISPFCLTVDREGHDYLRDMCQGMGYEVLADIHSLPRRLPALYRYLTV